MSKEELLVLLHDPEQTGLAVDELHRLVDEYPYFHTVHLLYLKGLQQTDPPQMALQLKKTALSVRDRDVLYRFINRPSSKNEIHDSQSNTNPLSEPQQKPFSANDEGKKATRYVITEGSVINNDELMNVFRQWEEQNKPSQTEEEKQPSPETVSTADDPAETADDNATVEIRDVYSTQQLTDDLIKISDRRTDSSASSQHENTAEEETSEATPEETATDQDQRVWSQTELIDGFLKINPKIVPNESQFTVDLAESLQEDQDIATEILADIHIDQGHKDKAIEIYKQLILKYPEKNIYFAAQIERLKNN